jgi:hypothetical protein
MNHMESSMRTGVTAVGGTATPAGQRLQLSVAFLEFIGEEMRTLGDRWEERKAELLAEWADTA